MLMESFAGLTKELSSLRWRDLLRQIQQREPERVEQNQRRQEHCRCALAEKTYYAGTGFEPAVFSGHGPDEFDQFLYP